MGVESRTERKKARGQIPQSTRFNVFRRDNFSCRYCGRSSPDVILHCDHAVSVKEGGDDSEGNLVTACIDCNLGKSWKSVHPKIKNSEPSDGLVGLWGHSFVEDDLLEDRQQIQWQFKIIRKVTADLYICQLFSFMDGEPTNCESITTEVLTKKCRLYATNGQMLHAYENENRHRNWAIERLGGIGAAYDLRERRNLVKLALVK